MCVCVFVYVCVCVCVCVCVFVCVFVCVCVHVCVRVHVCMCVICVDVMLAKVQNLHDVCITDLRKRKPFTSSDQPPHWLLTLASFVSMESPPLAPPQ